MTQVEARILLNEIGATSNQIDRLIEEVQERNGFTEFHKIGPMQICLARVPGTFGRTENYQVTIK